MATQTYTFTDDDNQIWCKATAGSSKTDTWTVTVAGLPAGVIINSATLKFTLGHTYDTPYSTSISIGGTLVWSDYSPSSGARTIDVSAHIAGNGAVTLTFKCTAPSSGSSGRSYAVFSSISLVIDYTNPCSTFTLDKSSIDAGGAVTVSITRADTSYTHRVTFSFGTRTYTEADVATSLTYTFPLTWLDQIPNAESGNCTVKVETFSGSTSMGYKTAQLTITAGSGVVPTVGTIAASVVEGHWGLYIQGHSKCQVSVSGYAAGTGATVSSVYISGNGDSAWADTLTTGPLRTTGKVSFTVTVKDSRGRSSSDQVSIEVTAYTDVAIASKTAYRCKEDGTASKTAGKCAMLGVTYTYTAIGDNAVTVQVFWRPYGTADWTELEEWDDTNGYTAVGLMDSVALDARYEVRFLVCDAISQAEQIAVITPGAVFMVWSKIRQSLGFGIYPTASKQIAIADDWTLMLGDVDVKQKIAELEAAIAAINGGNASE